MNSIRLASILWFAGVAAAGPVYNVVDLGTLGGTSAQAFGLSSNGIAAGAATTPSGYTHAFQNSGSGITDLTLNSNAGQGIASAVNSSGQVAGTAYVNGQAYATIWADSTTRAIAAAGSYAMTINNAGQVAGMLTSGGQGHAFVTENGAVVDLGTLPGGTWSSAYAINDQGDVAGYGQIGNGDFRGFVWSPGDGYIELGTLGGANSYAMAINDSGEVAGSSQTGSGYSHAFVENGGVLTDLGTLGGNSSYAYGINSADDVVGYSSVAGNGATDAFVFENGVMIDLNTLIAASGWILTDAYAINNDGEIVGAGLLDGVEHAFLLDPLAGLPGISNSDPPPQNSGANTPEPDGMTLVILGLALIFLSRLRLRRPPKGRPVEPPQ
jgi:probable HAF family extracellular repeat protein